jgi:hypothetical protein
MDHCKNYDVWNKLRAPKLQKVGGYQLLKPQQSYLWLLVWVSYGKN